MPRNLALLALLAAPTANGQSLLSTLPQTSPQASASAGLGGSTYYPLGVGVEGDQPMDVVMALAGEVAVVSLRDSNSLEFYDVQSGTRLGDVTVLAGPTDLDVTPDGSTIFVACTENNRVCVVDASTRTVTSVIPCATRPFQVAALADNQRAVVACDSSPAAGTLQLIDRTTDQVLASSATDPLSPFLLTTNVGAGIQLPTRVEFAVAPDGATIAVPSASGFSIELFSGANLTSAAKYTGLGTAPFRAAASPDSSYFAVGSTAGLAATNRVYRVPSGGAVLQEFSANGTGARGDVAITPDGASILYGTDFSVLKIDATTGQVVGSAFVLDNDGGNIEIDSSGTYAIAGAGTVNRIRLDNLTTQIFWNLPSRARLAVHPTGTQVVAVSPLIDEDITAVDYSGSSVDFLWDRPLGVPAEVDAPQEVELTADRKRAVLTCPTSRNVAVADLDSGALESVIAIGGRAAGLAVSPTADLALVCVADMQRLDVVDLAAGQVVQAIPTLGQPQFAFFSPDGSRAMVAASSTGNGEVEFYDVSGTSLMSTGRVTVPDVFWGEGHRSPDGSKLAFVDFESIAILDVANQTTVAVVDTPQFAQDGNWSPDSQHFAWSCDVVQTRVVSLGAGAPTVQIYPAPSLTAGAAFGPESSYLYQYVLGDYLRVVELATGNFVGEVLIGPAPMPSIKFRPRWFQAIGDQLLVVRNEEAATICRVRLGGPATEVLENVAFPTEGTADVAFDLAGGRLVVPASVTGDGMRVIRFGGEVVRPLRSSHCQFYRPARLAPGQGLPRRGIRARPAEGLRSAGR